MSVVSVMGRGWVGDGWGVVEVYDSLIWALGIVVFVGLVEVAWVVPRVAAVPKCVEGSNSSVGLVVGDDLCCQLQELPAEGCPAVKVLDCQGLELFNEVRPQLRWDRAFPTIATGGAAVG